MSRKKNETEKGILTDIENKLSESVLTPPAATTDNPTIEDVARQLLQFPDEPLPESYFAVLREYIEQYHPKYEVIEKQLSLIQQALPTIDRLNNEVGISQMKAATLIKEELNLSIDEESIIRALHRYRNKSRPK